MYLGFVKYNGMTAEQFLVAWFRSKFLMPSHFVFKSDNYYAMKYQNIIENNLKRDFIKNKKEPKTKKIKHKSKNKKKKSVESEVDNDVKDTDSNI